MLAAQGLRNQIEQGSVRAACPGTGIFLTAHYTHARAGFSGVLDGTADFNIWSVGASGEIAGGTAVLHSNTDPVDTTDDIISLFRSVVRIRPDATDQAY